MQAWQSVQCTNENSGFLGQAGCVVRTERNDAGNVSIVHVRMDNTGTVETFDPSELRVLG